MTVFFRIISLAVAIAFAAVTAEAKSAGPSLLFDPATGLVVSQERAGEVWYPASLTKLMTAYLVFKRLRSGEMRLDRKIPVSVFANSQRSSKIGIKPGGAVTVDFALQALLVYSANDMAVVLAEAAGGTSYRFVREMNRSAAVMGLTGTHFANPNGLFDPRQVTTARDMGILAATILAGFPEYAHYFSQQHVAVGKRKLRNHNSLIRQMPESDGMKTGFVCNSGFNLVASASRGGRRLIAVVLGADTPKGRADLAQMLLTDGLGRELPPNRPRLTQIANDKLGALVPADMTATVCRRKATVALVSARELGGWGISLGSFDTAEKAGMALRGRLLSPAGLEAPGEAGVIRMPAKSRFAAMLWNLDKPTAGSLCIHYLGQNAPCEVMTPEAFAKIAALSTEPAPRPQKPVAQGSDAGSTKKKKKKRAK
ncbi:MAG: D-alanyl-D-alanine carboxypeptidase family protein [Hyphomicrobiales bacterium]